MIGERKLSLLVRFVEWAAKVCGCVLWYVFVDKAAFENVAARGRRLDDDSCAGSCDCGPSCSPNCDCKEEDCNCCDCCKGNGGTNGGTTEDSCNCDSLDSFSHSCDHSCDSCGDENCNCCDCTCITKGWTCITKGWTCITKGFVTYVWGGTVALIGKSAAFLFFYWAPLLSGLVIMTVMFLRWIKEDNIVFSVTIIILVDMLIGDMMQVPVWYAAASQEESTADLIKQWTDLFALPHGAGFLYFVIEFCHNMLLLRFWYGQLGAATHQAAWDKYEGLVQEATSEVRRLRFGGEIDLICKAARTFGDELTQNEETYRAAEQVFFGYEIEHERKFGHATYGTDDDQDKRKQEKKRKNINIIMEKVHQHFVKEHAVAWAKDQALFQACPKCKGNGPVSCMARVEKCDVCEQRGIVDAYIIVDAVDVRETELPGSSVKVDPLNPLKLYFRVEVVEKKRISGKETPQFEGIWACRIKDPDGWILMQEPESETRRRTCVIQASESSGPFYSPCEKCNANSIDMAFKNIGYNCYQTLAREESSCSYCDGSKIKARNGMYVRKKKSEGTGIPRDIGIIKEIKEPIKETDGKIFCVDFAGEGEDLPRQDFELLAPDDFSYEVPRKFRPEADYTTTSSPFEVEVLEFSKDDDGQVIARIQSSQVGSPEEEVLANTLGFEVCQCGRIFPHKFVAASKFPAASDDVANQNCAFCGRRPQQACIVCQIPFTSGSRDCKHCHLSRYEQMEEYVEPYCTGCEGRGRKKHKVCFECHGTGLKFEDYNVTLPADPVYRYAALFVNLGHATWEIVDAFVLLKLCSVAVYNGHFDDASNATAVSRNVTDYDEMDRELFNHLIAYGNGLSNVGILVAISQVLLHVGTLEPGWWRPYRHTMLAIQVIFNVCYDVYCALFLCSLSANIRSTMKSLTMYLPPGLWPEHFNNVLTEGTAAESDIPTTWCAIASLTIVVDLLIIGTKWPMIKNFALHVRNKYLPSDTAFLPKTPRSGQREIRSMSIAFSNDPKLPQLERICR